MVVQDIKLGNIRSLFANALPTGEKARVTWTFFLTLIRNSLKRFNGVGMMPLRAQSLRAELAISSNCCAFYRFGTSPEFRMLLMSSTIFSLIICVSTNKNRMGLRVTPAYIKVSDRSSSQLGFIEYPLMISTCLSF